MVACFLYSLSKNIVFVPVAILCALTDTQRDHLFVLLNSLRYSILYVEVKSFRQTLNFYSRWTDRQTNNHYYYK